MMSRLNRYIWRKSDICFYCHYIWYKIREMIWHILCYSLWNIDLAEIVFVFFSYMLFEILLTVIVYLFNYGNLWYIYFSVNKVVYCWKNIYQSFSTIYYYCNIVLIIIIKYKYLFANRIILYFNNTCVFKFIWLFI